MIYTEGETLVVDEIILATGYSQYLNDLIPERETRKRLVANTMGLFPTQIRGTTVLEEYRGIFQSEKSHTDLTIVGAATFKNIAAPSLKFIDANDAEGNLVGTRIQEDLVKNEGKSPNIHSAQSKVEDRIQYLYSLTENLAHWSPFNCIQQ